MQPEVASPELPELHSQSCNCFASRRSLFLSLSLSLVWPRPALFLGCFCADFIVECKKQQRKQTSKAQGEGKGREGKRVQPQGHEIDKAIGPSGLLLKFRHRSLMPLLMVFDSP